MSIDSSSSIQVQVHVGLFGAMLPIARRSDFMTQSSPLLPVLDQVFASIEQLTLASLDCKFGRLSLSFIFISDYFAP